MSAVLSGSCQRPKKPFGCPCKSLACGSQVGLFLRQQPWDDVSIDICEAEVATGVAVCQAFMVKAQFGGVTRIDKFFFYGGLKTKFLRQQARDYIAVNIR